MVSNLPTEIKRFKKVQIVSRRDTSEINKILVEEDFKIVDKNPDFILCYGGDGTVLFSERTFSTVPKLIIKTSKPARIYDYKLIDLKKILNKIKTGDYKLHKEMKLETTAKNTKLIGLNEIQIHLKSPIYAVRFSLNIKGKKYDKLIGDGVIFATPFGSTAYYKATGGHNFKKGIGISFNNLHNQKIDSYVVSEDSTLSLTITRGPAWLIADNNEDFVELLTGDKVIIRKSQNVANFIYLSTE